MPVGRAGVHRPLLRQHGQARGRHVAPRRLRRAAGRGPMTATARCGALADELRRVQALHATRPAWRCARPARCSAPSSARWWCRRTSATAAATACRRAPSGCSTSGGRRAGLQVHALLRPARGRHDAGVRQGLSDRVDPVRAARRAAGGPTPGSRRCRARVTEARLYGADPDDGVGGVGAFFLLLDEPEIYGLPPDPVVTTRDLREMWRAAGAAAWGCRAWPVIWDASIARRRTGDELLLRPADP